MRRRRRPPWEGPIVQVFLAVRDAERRVAVLSLRQEPDLWMLPSENVFAGGDPAEVARTIAPRWFATDMAWALAELLNFPPDPDDDRWFLLPVFEASKPAHFAPTPDTHAVRFVAPGDPPPGRMFKDHAEVLARLAP